MSKTTYTHTRKERPTICNVDFDTVSSHMTESDPTLLALCSQRLPLQHDPFPFFNTSISVLRVTASKISHMLDPELHRTRQLHTPIFRVACTILVPNFQHHTIRKTLLVLDGVVENRLRGRVMRQPLQDSIVVPQCRGRHPGYEDGGEIRQGL